MRIHFSFLSLLSVSCFAVMFAATASAHPLDGAAASVANQSVPVVATPDDGIAALMETLRSKGLPKTAIPADINGSLSLFLNQEAPPKEEFDPDVVSVWVYDHQKDRLSKLLTSTLPDDAYWYKMSGGESQPCSVSEIHAIHYAKQIPFTNKIILGGCPDARNIYSFIVDVDTKEALLLPTNSSFGGFTPEEDYIIMFSYAYNTAVDENGDLIGGRHTVIDVFDANGERIDSMSLERDE